MSGSMQAQYLARGGPMSGVMDAKIERGELDPTYQFREYPKMIYVSLGLKTEHKTTDQIRGRDVITAEWDETREHFREIIVNSEAEEEAVLSGGKSATEVEDQRQEMIATARARNIQVDPTWGLTRLQRELGAAPTNEAVEVLRARVADLEEKAALRAHIAALEAQIARASNNAAAWPSSDGSSTMDMNFPNPTFAERERDAVRQQLMDLGVAVDMRWALPRLRAELDAATGAK